VNTHPLGGVYAVALTPLTQTGEIDLDSLCPFLDYLARRGCHGALLFGTTGEGPSFAYTERVTLWRVAIAIRQTHPHFRLLAGTGTPSLEEPILLTRAAFDLGLDGVVVLPPYYFRSASDDGLYTWYNQVIQRSVPQGGVFLAYHIPGISGVSLSIDLLARLADTFPTHFTGLKDSSNDLAHAHRLADTFQDRLLILNGNDRLFPHTLPLGVHGCTTALANLCSPDARQVWDAWQTGTSAPQAAARLAAARAVLDDYPPAPPTLKAILAHQHPFPRWSVRPPLLPLSPERENLLMATWTATHPSPE
jgi:4-hydroxy-tetrahydrodipicolinate synthase